MKSKHGKEYNKIIVYEAIILVIILMVAIGTVAYAKMRIVKNGTVLVDVAGIKCQTELVSNEESVNIIDPYCEILVKNYDEDNVVTEVAFDYIITVEDKDGTLPEYWCVDSLGNEVMRSTSGNAQICGTMECDSQEVHSYKLYFVNSGESNVVKDIRLKTKTVQKES